MNLTFKKDHASTMDGFTTPIVNEDGDLGDDEVGEIRFEKGVGRHITLYSRYKGTVKSHEECEAFDSGPAEKRASEPRKPIAGLSLRPCSPFHPLAQRPVMC